MSSSPLPAPQPPADDADAGAGPSTSAGAGRERPGPVSWDMGTDLALSIANLITAEHSPFFDDSDLAKVAASCACAGNTALGTIADAIWQFLSPRFQEELDVTENSNAKELKALLKSWGRTQSGNKADLWKRIQDEVVGDNPEEDEDGGGEGGEERRARCPVARGVKRRILEQQVARVSKTKAKDVYGVSKYKLAGLETKDVLQPSFGLIQTYAVKDLKPIARGMYTSYSKLQADQQRSKDWMANYTSTRDDRRDRIVEVLKLRGVREDDAKRAADHFWHLPFFCEFRSGCGEAPSAEWLRTGAEAAANQAHAWLFHLARTSFRDRFMLLRATHQFRKSSKYKQEAELEQRAFALALSDWVEERQSLLDATSHPALPQHMRPEVERLWQRRQAAAAAGGSGAAAAGAGGSGGAGGGAAAARAQLEQLRQQQMRQQQQAAALLGGGQLLMAMMAQVGGGAMGEGYSDGEYDDDCDCC